MSSIGTKLDAGQVLKQVYDEANNRLRTDSTFSGSVGDVVVKDQNNDYLNINADGSLNANIVNDVNVELNAADGDNVAISDGTDTVAVNPDGSVNVNVLDITLSHANDSVRIGDGTSLVTTTLSQDTSKVGFDTVNLAKPFTKPWDRVRVTTKNTDGDPTVIITSFNGVDVQMASIIYDTDGDFQDLQVTDL